MTSDIYNAALRGRVDSLREIIDAGADVNVQNENGYTPLIAAAHDGRIECIELLVDRGANANLEDESGFTALTTAVQHSNEQTVQLLISKGADVNHRTTASFTPLMFLAYNNCPPTSISQVANALLAAGADKDAKDDSGLTALDHARNKGIEELIALLEK
jgi:ankyrin repeat protein